MIPKKPVTGLDPVMGTGFRIMIMHKSPTRDSTRMSRRRGKQRTALAFHTRRLSHFSRRFGALGSRPSLDPAPSDGGLCACCEQRSGRSP